MNGSLPTACILCSHNCGLRVDVEEGVIVRVRPDPGNPMTRGYMCNKATGIPAYVRHAQRLRHPLKRGEGGEHQRIGWRQAMSEISQRLLAIRGRWGPRSVALVGVGGQGNHMDSQYALWFLEGLGSPWWFNSMAQEKTQHMLVDRWMLDAAPTSYLHADLDRCRFLMVMGTNPVISHRGRNPRLVLREISRDPSRTLVVVDPRLTETAELADRHVRVRPGTDSCLLLGLVAEIVRRGLYDRQFVRRHTTGFEELMDVVGPVDTGTMADRCGVEEGLLCDLAEQFASASSAAVFWDLGVEQVPYSTLNSYLIRLLLAITGNLGRPGGNAFFPMFAPDVRRLLEGEAYRASISGIQGIVAFSASAMFSPNLLAEEIEAEHPERIRAVIVEGANPLITAADTKRLRDALRRLELLVVVDPALSETAREADYVLPTPVGYEKWEWSGFPNGFPEIYAQVRPPVVPPPEEALPEAEIYARLAETMGVVPEPPRVLSRLAAVHHRPWGAAALLTVATALAWLRSRSVRGAVVRVLFWTYRTVGPRLAAPALAAIWLNCHLFALTRRRDVLRTLGKRFRRRSPWALGAVLFQRILSHPEGVEIARVDAERNLEAVCGFPDGKVRLAPRPMLEELQRLLGAVERDDGRDDDFPFVLNAGERRLWNANTIVRDPAWRRGRGPHCSVRIHPRDAGRLGVASGDQVRLESRRGCVTLAAEVDERVHPGQLSAPAGFGTLYPGAAGALSADGVNVNLLTEARERDRFTGIPYHKHVRCRVVRCE